MTHELKKIVQAYLRAREQKLKTVLATVVALDGSSYRRPGVRMLIRGDGTMIGAVSGGCVEKEVLRQAETVFRTNIPKVMTYDGRYRLGCEGLLYILIEPFAPNSEFMAHFDKAIKLRGNFSMCSHFELKDNAHRDYGTLVHFKEAILSLRPEYKTGSKLQVFEQEMAPCLQLLIFGSEHDTVQLCSYASMTGWEVTVVTTPAEEKKSTDFPGAQQLLSQEAETLDMKLVDSQTAVMLMSHSYVKDLKYLLALRDTHPLYLGMLGPFKRREKLFNEFLERCPEVTEAFFEDIHGPAGLDIGAETPQEIAVAIIAEILSVARQKKPIPLKDKEAGIHS
ncbi:XdhC family protein [Spongiimicrobium sp. 2-473A-2-J]|uniref:XdhC family protein n=1 Tax=Eudoraea algarum TaxID=3417568 RepID=UPI003D3629A5